jgi:hypothetical protein
VAFRSSRAEPFGEAFLRRSIRRLLVGDLPGVRVAFLDAVRALRRRELSTHDVSSRVRLTKTPAKYLETRARRRELPYEALLAGGRTEWKVGERIRVYRTRTGSAVVGDPDLPDRRDYDVEHYLTVLRDTFAARLARALRPGDGAALFDDPAQLSLVPPAFESMRTILTVSRL